MRAGVDEERGADDPLLDLFVRLVGVASPTGAEREVADVVTAYLRDLGVDVTEDDTATVTGCGAGNLVARVPGRGEAPAVGLCAHLDTVPVDHAPQVRVAGGSVCSDGATALGADDKAGVAVLLELARNLVAQPPLGDVELVFTVGEEDGLLGAKALDLATLTARQVFVLDGDGPPGTVITASPTQKRIIAELTGVAAHAGMAPELGRSAVVAAAHAVSAMRLGRLDDDTTANVGIVRGGAACNVVPAHCLLEGEARSLNEAKVTAQTEHMVQAIASAAGAAGVDVEIDVREPFHSYRHKVRGPLLAVGAKAARLAGLEPRLVPGGGGSDANAFNLRGLPALALGAGYEHAHSPQEAMSIDALHQLYALAAGVVRAAGTAA